MQIKFKKLRPNAKAPSFAKDGDAGADLTVATSQWVNENKIRYFFGIAVEIPRGFVGLIFPRSSLHKTGMLLSNCVGVIDSGYRGEITAVFHVGQFHEEAPIYSEGERACQLVIVEIPTVEYVQANSLSDTERGTGGYGSSGR